MKARIDIEDIFRAHQREIFVFLARTVGDSGLAEDLAQETFLRAYRGALAFRGDSSVRTWLFTIARNVASSHYRRHQPQLLGGGLPDVTAPARDDALRMDIESLLQRLPLPAREALVLCDVLGFGVNEAADLVGLNRSTFRVRLHRARARFQENYTDAD